MSLARSWLRTKWQTTQQFQSSYTTQLSAASLLTSSGRSTKPPTSPLTAWGELQDWSQILIESVISRSPWPSLIAMETKTWPSSKLPQLWLRKASTSWCTSNKCRRKTTYIGQSGIRLIYISTTFLEGSGLSCPTCVPTISFCTSVASVTSLKILECSF